MLAELQEETLPRSAARARAVRVGLHGAPRFSNALELTRWSDVQKSLVDSKRRAAQHGLGYGIGSGSILRPWGVNTKDITIIEGGREFCAYCVIPCRRGKERSRTSTSVLAKARQYGRRPDTRRFSCWARTSIPTTTVRGSAVLPSYWQRSERCRGSGRLGFRLPIRVTLPRIS